MKKLLIFIFSIFFGLIGFTSAESFSFDWGSLSADMYDLMDNSASLGSINFKNSVNVTGVSFYVNRAQNGYYTINDSNNNVVLTASCDDNYSHNHFLCGNIGYCCYFTGSVIFEGGVDYTLNFNYINGDGGIYVQFPDSILDFSDFTLKSTYFDDGYSCLGLYRIYYEDYVTSPTIKVNYNNGSFTTVSCDGVNEITIDGLSTMSSISTFTPYFNINYTDQNNQVLTDSYSNSILYLSGGQYLKTYTGGSNNDWILNLVTSEDTLFTGYLPTFDVTGNITEIDTGNVFNNFAENSLTVLLSNIPNYIQYVIMFTLLLFVLGVFRKLRK